MSHKRLLHVGCGRANPNKVPAPFRGAGWQEVRLDIDPAVAPDVVASITDMAEVADGSVDAVFSSHNIEHLYAHEVPRALAEFHRVLKADGLLLIACPDLQAAAALVADDKLTETAYTSPAGAIAALDMIYGHRASLARGRIHMAHKSGFTRKVLMAAVRAAGFASVAAARRPEAYELRLVATKDRRDEAQIRALAARYLGW